MFFARENFYMARRLRALEISTKTACYEAALMGDRIFNPENEPEAHATPGAAGGAPIAEFTIDALRRALMADGLTPVGTLALSAAVPRPRDGYYLVAAFMTPENAPIRDYHFLRQELVQKRNGRVMAGKRWCHNLVKGAFACPSYEIGGRTNVTDPRTAIEDISAYVADEKGGYEVRTSRYSVFAGFFECPISGLDVKPRPQGQAKGWQAFPAI